VNGIVIVLVLVVTGIVGWQRYFGLAGRVRDASGRVVPAADVLRVGAALARDPNDIEYLFVDKPSDKIPVIVSDQNAIMDLKGILEGENT